MNLNLAVAPSNVRGFNYHPFSSTCAMEDWTLFDISEWRKDLTLAKKYFPQINTIRIWLSWNAYCRLEDAMIAEIKQVIDLCRELNLYIVPCIFNRWHDPQIDCDGVYIDHFLPKSSWLLKYGNLFEDYLDALCDSFGQEKQILVWDLCNEPFAYGDGFEFAGIVKKYEKEWLMRIYSRMKAKGVRQPLGIGSTGNESLKEFDECCDIFLTHMYYRGDTDTDAFDAYVHNFVLEAEELGKPLVSSECCWGSEDDRQRAFFIKTTLDTFRKYNVGFIVHALAYSKFADLHDRADGRVSKEIGNLSFLRKDKSIRPYHEIFNNY